MLIFSIILIFIVGAIFGSFLTSYTYRTPRGESVKRGRSICPHCKTTISWFDNIPIISYIALRGKCRNCGKAISWRYPAIEILSGLLFVIIYQVLIVDCTRGFATYGICMWESSIKTLTLPYFLILATVFIAIFVIDLEHQLIPDELVFTSFAFTALILIFSNADQLYLHFFSGFFSASILLGLHIITKGKGMGLGDVKLALTLGVILGWPITYTWFLVSFILGGAVGILLLILKKVRFGQHIPFGPFMITSFFISLIWGDFLVNYRYPFLN